MVPSPETLQRFAAALDVPLDHLFREEGATPHGLTPRKSETRANQDLVGPNHQFFSKLRSLAARMGKADGAFCSNSPRSW